MAKARCPGPRLPPQAPSKAAPDRPDRASQNREDDQGEPGKLLPEATCREEMGSNLPPGDELLRPEPRGLWKVLHIP